MSRDADLSALKKLYSQPRSDADMPMIVGMLNTENDRTVALVCSTLIEEALKDAILSRMVQLSRDDSDKLFSGYAPLASMSAKTLIAFALGIIGKKTRQNLQTLRAVRNAFAHARAPLTFDTIEVAAACKHLNVGSQFAEEPPKQLLEMIEGPGMRQRYIGLSMLIWSSLLHVPQAMSTSRPTLP